MGVIGYTRQERLSKRSFKRDRHQSTWSSEILCSDIFVVDYNIQVISHRKLSWTRVCKGEIVRFSSHATRKRRGIIIHFLAIKIIMIDSSALRDRCIIS